MIYLNVAGLSPFNQAVQEEVAATLEEFSRLLYSDEGIHHYRETLQRCRQSLAQWLQVENAERLAFVPNTTTASSLVLSRIHWKSGDHVLTTTHENSTVLKEILALKPQGVQIHSLDPSSPDEFEREIKQRVQTTHVRAIVISHVSHIDGRILPIERLSQLTQKYHVLLIVDGAQAVGHIPVSFSDWQPDAYFFPGHKWCAGPMGTGALILGKEFTEREELHKPSWADFELGTQNIGLIAGFSKACDIKLHQPKDYQNPEARREALKTTLQKHSGIRILEWEGPHSLGILSFACLSEKAEQFIQSFSFTHSIAWKTFSHRSFPGHLSVRLSWTADTPESDISCVLDAFHSA